jgi:hypothetical protein
MDPIKLLKLAKAALKDNNPKEALDILKSITSTSARIENCPSCATANLVLAKSDRDTGECSSCGSVWVSKHGSNTSLQLVKSGRNVKDLSEMKGKPEIVDRLWDMYLPGNADLTAYDINNYTATGWIRKSILDKLGISQGFTTVEDLQKSQAQITKNASERTWGGLGKDQILNMMLGMFKSGEEKPLVNRHSITKFEQTNEIDQDVLKVVLVKAGKDPNELSKDGLSKSSVKLEDRDGMDPDLDPGQGRKAVSLKNLTVGNLEELITKNPANGSPETEMKAPSAEKPSGMEKSLFFAPESNLKGSWVAGTKDGIYKSLPTVDGFALEYYPMKQNRFILEKGSFKSEYLGHFTTRDGAHGAAENHFLVRSGKLTKASVPSVIPTTESVPEKLGPHFVFSAENPGYPDKRSIKGDHENVLAGLKAMGMDAHGTTGKYGKDERSILVVNPTPSHVKSLHQIASGLGQESGIESNGEDHKMVYYHGPNAGKYHAGKGTEQFEAGPSDDFYTKHPTGAGHFRHNFDFEHLHDPSIEKAMGGKVMPLAGKPTMRGAPGGAKAGFSIDPPMKAPSPYKVGGALTGGASKAKMMGVKTPNVLKAPVMKSESVKKPAEGKELYDAADKLGLLRNTPKGSKPKEKPPVKKSAPATDGISSVGGVGGPKPKGDVLMKDPIRKKVIKSLNDQLSDKQLTKSEAQGLIETVMKNLQKSNSVLSRQLLRKYAEIAVQVDLTNDDDWR